MNNVLLLTICFASTFWNCKSNKIDSSNMQKTIHIYTIDRVQPEMNGETLHMTGEDGHPAKMVISIPNGNYVDVKAGDQISVEVQEIMESYPIQIIGRNIKVLSSADLNENAPSDLPTLTVTKITHGKDGYTAQLENEHGDIYHTTLSITNMGDAYKELSVGDQVKIKGTYSSSNGHNTVQPTNIYMVHTIPQPNFVKSELLVGFSSAKTYMSTIEQLEKTHMMWATPTLMNVSALSTHSIAK